MAGMAAGQDRGVVRQGHGRERGQSSVPACGPGVDQTRHVGGFAAIDQVVEHIGIRPVPEEPDQMPGSTRSLDEGFDDGAVQWREE
jgi:hypothetical protein